MTSWQKTDYPGVRFREHPTRKHKGKPDRYYSIRWMQKGRAYEEALGWASEGWSPSRGNGELVDRKKGRLPEPNEDTPKQSEQSRIDQRESVIQPLTQQGKTESAPAVNQPCNTFKQGAELFIEWAKANKKSWMDDKQRLNKHVLPVLGDYDLSSIGFPEVEMLKLRCQNKGLAAATVVQCLALTRSVINFSIKMRLFTGSNPVKDVKFPKLNNRRLRFLTHQEARLLLDTAVKHNPELHDMCLICLYTGMRAGEMIALRWFDIDFKHDLITIRDSKNGDNRQVFMVDKVKAMLKKRKKDAPSALVFPTHDGKQRVRVSKMFLRLINKLGFNEGVTDPRYKVCFHTLRHTFASWLALQGETLLTIKDLMGHKSIEMTMRYAHLIPDQKKRALQKLCAL